jgi:NADH dehydrogenase/NADH:ubiquinone oxidoreductase subunit G
MDILKVKDFSYAKSHIKSTQRDHFLFNRRIEEFEEMDTIVLVGFNPKLESPVLNSRILRGVNHRGMKVYKIGAADDLNYDYTHLGNNYEILNNLIENKGDLKSITERSKNCHIILGPGLYHNGTQINTLIENLNKFS